MGRKDGTEVKNMDSLHKIMPHLMKNRCDAEVYSIERIDITKLMKYLDKLNKDKEYKTTLFHAVIAAMAKTIHNRPLLNRFISGRKFYDRNAISFGFTAKNKFEDNAEERLIILKTKYDMNLESISNTIWGEVTKTRKNDTNDMNDTLGFVTKFPRCITALIMAAFRIMDFYGVVPRSISDTDPNYATVMISNLGSIKADCCYHHLNNYGTNSIIATIGVIKEVKEKSSNGKETTKKYVDIAFTLDERIADGFYFAKSIKLFKHILENPSLLEEELHTKIDIEEKK